jgi:hypothetical protein
MSYFIDPAIVEARNLLNANAMEAEAEIIAILTPWIGRKIRKTSGYGGWVAKLEPVFTAFSKNEDAHGCRAWLSGASKWLRLECQSTNYLTGDRVSYNKTALSIGEVDDTGVLLQLFEPSVLRTNYTADEINTARAEAYRLESEAQNLRNTIREFER